MKNNIIAGYVAKYLAATGTRKEELAVRLHVSYSTLCYKLNDPNKFTRGELIRLFKALKLSDEERLECMK